MSVIKYRFSINFDLYTDKKSEVELKKKVGISLSRMYEIIKNHLCNNGFEWVQGSGYISIDHISSYKLTSIINELYDNNLWLGHFTRDIKRTIVDDKTYSYDRIIKKYDRIYKEIYNNKNIFEEIIDNSKIIKNTLKEDMKKYNDGFKNISKQNIISSNKNKNNDNDIPK